MIRAFFADRLLPATLVVLRTYKGSHGPGLHSPSASRLCPKPLPLALHLPSVACQSTILTKHMRPSSGPALRAGQQLGATHAAPHPDRCLLTAHRRRLLQAAARERTSLGRYSAVYARSSAGRRGRAGSRRSAPRDGRAGGRPQGGRGGGRGARRGGRGSWAGGGGGRSRAHAETGTGSSLELSCVKSSILLLLPNSSLTTTTRASLVPGRAEELHPLYFGGCTEPCLVPGRPSDRLPLVLTSRSGFWPVFTRPFVEIERGKARGGKNKPDILVLSDTCNETT